jgi:hypothetical protein
MTTIKAAPPVETPTGLIVALPPLDHSSHYGSCNWLADSSECCRENCRCHLNPSDVFALAVPCPTCDGTRGGGKVVAGSGFCVCFDCDGEGWVHHGDYRVLGVLPIRVDYTDHGTPSIIVMGKWMTSSGKVFYVPADGKLPTQIDLPGAVPGGVALIVERVE